MAKAVNANPNASDSEQVSLTVVAALYPAKWTVVLTEPSGGRGATGGSTADLVVYQGEPGEDASPGTIDVYTPENSDAQSIRKKVEEKLHNQAKGVCVDLVNVKYDKRDTVRAALESLAAVEKKAHIVTHVNGADVQAYGKRLGS